MKWFFDLKISRKLLAVFLIVIAMTIFLGVYSLLGLIAVNRASSDIATKWLPSIRASGQMQASLARYRISESSHILSTEEADRAGIEKSMATRMEIFRKLEADYAALISQGEEARVFPELKSTLEAYAAVSAKLLALSRAGSKDEARALFRDASNKLFRKANEQMEALAKINDDGSLASNADAGATFHAARRSIVALLIGVTVIALSLAMFLAGIVSRPLAQAVAIAKRVADGDLSATIVAVSEDETGQLMHSLKAMNDSLLRVVGQVRQGTDTIATASSEIASGNLDLSSRTEEQASSLEQTASAMEQLTSTVKQNADNARQADQLAQSASQVASEGGKVVGEVIATMESISGSSRKIVDIISVIDGIAFQTNILALNAAVEAARAGEQGRGFAVVASEVRNLAQRSAAAAKEIKMLIDDSVSKVGSGTALVQRAGATMGEVVASVRRVSDVVAEISAASNEQSAGIEEVNRAIAQMDEVTQQNAALVEQAAAAAASMQEQAARLAAVVGVFQLGRDGAAGRLAPALH